MCLGAIYWARLDRIFYAGTRQEAALAGFDDETIYSQVALAPGDRSIPGIQLMTEEARRVFEKWMSFPERVSY